MPSSDAPAATLSATASAGISYLFDVLLDDQTSAGLPTPGQGGDFEVPEDGRSTGTTAVALGLPSAATGTDLRAVGVSADPAAGGTPAAAQEPDRNDPVDADPAAVVFLPVPLAPLIPLDVDISTPAGDLAARARIKAQDVIPNPIEAGDLGASRAPVPRVGAQDIQHSATESAADKSPTMAFETAATRSAPSNTDLQRQTISPPVTPDLAVPTHSDGRREISPGHARALAHAILRTRLSERIGDPPVSIAGGRPSEDLQARPQSKETAVEMPPLSSMLPPSRAQNATTAAAGRQANTFEAARATAVREAQPGDAPAGAGQGSESRPQGSPLRGDGTIMPAVQSIRGAPTGLEVQAAFSQARALSPAIRVEAPAISNEAGVARAIVQGMRLQWRAGVGEAVVQLDPKYLGVVSIALKVDNGVVTATLRADDPGVRSWMEANELLLRQGLADHGLSLARLVVSEPQQTKEQEFQEGRPQQERQTPHRKFARPNAESSTFEVVV